MELATASYLDAGADLRDPRHAPAYAELPAGSPRRTSPPPASTRCATRARPTRRKLTEAGVPVELRRFDDQIHGFLNIVGVGRTSRAAVAEIAARLKAGLGA